MAVAHKQDNGAAVQAVAPESNPETDPVEESAADRIAKMLDKSKSFTRSKVKVQRIKENGEEVYCNMYTCEEFERGNTLELVRKHFGAGRYMVELYGQKPTAKSLSCYSREIYELADAPAPDQPDMREIVREALMSATPQPTSDATPATAFGSLKEMLQLIVMLREALVPPPPPPPPPLTSQLVELIAVMRGAKDIAREIDPPDQPSDPLMAIAQQALPIVAEAIKGQQQRPILAPVTLPPTLAAPAPAATNLPSAPTNGQAPASSAEDDVNNQEFAELRDAVRGVNMMARMGLEPEGVANLLFEKLDDEVEPLLRSEDWFTKLCQIERGCAQHQDWYVKLRSFLLVFFEEEREEEAKDRTRAVVPHNGPAVA
jgi:hypothetical protein